ncbi:type III polyketide synthase [Salinibacterium sp. SWN1162]|uniref:type III polyketide synthase n=1 Tax=Salinibacterium sp. SWN1162 TaxID=2792053 RepID=UPI0018CEEBD7|nr:3-oxoacyl-[acyl-carrier-protein] synthase III C-terminal domain-containing protein [Salinibacterium sp. SWN1162]MBH0007950.1 type III polyketide synthase [Salinibacterium sp. SWN1162]
MSRVAAVAPVVPEHSYTQAEITAELGPLLSGSPSHQAIIERMHGASGIERRHTALPLERYRDLGSFRESNDQFIRVATDLLERALTTALADAGLTAADVDFVFFTSVTGVSAPSIDALLIPRLGLRPDVKRVPSFGLGCLAGAAGLARVHDYLVGHPDDVGVVLSVELCSLTLQRDDHTMANFVATGLFGDGAAAVVMVGENRNEPGPRVIDTRSTFVADSHDVIGWNVGGTGFEIVLSAGVADVIQNSFPGEVSDFLGRNGLTIADIDTWIAHPGGPRVLEAFESSLGLQRNDLQSSWDCLARVGNLSSAAVLHVLADALHADPAPAPGSHALAFALGPGVSAEFVLLEWS